MDREIKVLRKQRDFAESRIETMMRSGSKLVVGAPKFGIDETITLDLKREDSSGLSDLEKKQESEGDGNIANGSGYEALKRKIQDMQKTINCLVDLQPEEESPCSSEAAISVGSSRSKLTRSRSCRAVLTTALPSICLKDYEDANTARFEIDSPGSVQSFSWKISRSDRCTNITTLSRKDSCSSAVSTLFDMDNKEFDPESQRVSIRKLLRNDSQTETERTKEIDDGDTAEDFFGAEKGLRRKLFIEKFGANTEMSSTKNKYGSREFDSDDNLSVTSFVAKQKAEHKQVRRENPYTLHN